MAHQRVRWGLVGQGRGPGLLRRKAGPFEEESRCRNHQCKRDVRSTKKHHLPVTLTNEPSHLKSPNLPKPCRTNTVIHQKKYGNVGCLALPPSKFLVTNISAPVKSTLLTAKGWGLLIQFQEQSRRTRSSV